jgi:histidinol-phosphate phosphatase family protein
MTENLPKKPMNPYGQTKLEVEHMLEKLASERGLQSVALRYFNAAGAENEARVGEWHEPETHLIPRLLFSAMNGKPVEIYGVEYPTPDGTAIRDYIHVSDLAQAHEAAMLRLLEAPDTPDSKDTQGRFEAYNLGSESGYSVRQMIAACEKALDLKLETIEKPPRPGDPPRLVADATLAKKVLGFQPKTQALEWIFRTAAAWERTANKLRSRPSRAVFLDRDGTINLDPGYLSHPSQMQLIPGVGEALSKLQKAGFALIVVSNQSGVGRGIISAEALPKIHERLDELLAPHGAKISYYALCIHKPEDDCACRKPKTKLLEDGARALGVDISRSFMVGDKALDLQAGKNAGCKGSLLVRTGYGLETERKLNDGEADFIGDSLVQVAHWILTQETASP